jgi:hypothetical protein
LGAIVLLLGACRDGWENSPLAMDMVTDPHYSFFMTNSKRRLLDEVLAGLNTVNAMRDQCSSLSAKAELAAMVFETVHKRISPQQAAELRVAFDDRLVPKMLEPRSNALREALFIDLLYLKNGLAKVDRDALALRLQTGLDEIVIATDAEVPAGESARDLMREIEDDYELGGIARLAKLLLASLQFPRPLSNPDEMPIGGVADITNRGPLDRLILSELAYDDMTLAVRVALNESLYLRREPQARPMARQRFVLLDSGLRMWGVPRVFAAAVALAIAAQGDSHLAVNAWRADGEAVVPIVFASKKGLINHLAQLDHRLHPGAALPEFAKKIGDATISTDVVLVISDDTLADREFSQLLAESNIGPLFIVTVNREGEYRLLQRSRRGTKVLREARFNLDDVLQPRRKKSTALLDGRDEGLPAILNIEPFPLLASYQVRLDNSWYVQGVGTITLTSDGRLLCWSNSNFGADSWPLASRLADCIGA